MKLCHNLGKGEVFWWDYNEKGIDKMNEVPITVVIVDDHALVREGLQSFLELFDGYRLSVKLKTVKKQSQSSVKKNLTLY